MLIINIEEKQYNSKIVLKNIAISVNEAGIYGIVGKNGSGKTTFFKCLNHLISFKGSIFYQEKQLLPQQVAFLPTEPFLYEHLTVKEFYTFYRRLTQIPKEREQMFAVDESLLIKELSTGTRKKAYFNAVFQKDYDLYIFDEPFNGLDVESVYEVKKIINQLAKKHIVFVSSHILETLSNCKKIFLLQNHSFTEFLSSEINEIESLLMKNA